MAFRFSLDSVEVTEPKGWADAQIVVERDDTIKGLLYAYTTPVTFFDDGYTALKAVFDAGVCNTAEVLIEYTCNDGTFATFFEGVIFMTECVIDLDKCQIECVINDNHYGAKVKNNKKIKAQVNVGRSKNDTTIIPAPKTTVNMFTPSSGATNGVAREAYSIYDCFAFIIDFMSDGDIDFDSVAFGSGGDYEDYVITTGIAIRDPASNHPLYMNFEDLFTEIDKKFNITFWIDLSGAAPKMWIEPTEDVYNGATTETLTNVPGIKLQVDESRLYSVLKFGGNVTQEDDITFQFPDGRFFGHKEEEYHVLGTCNIDNTLDLVGSWVVDSNVIEDIVVNSVEDYDDDIFIIETDGAGAAVEDTQFAVPPATTPVVYNPSLVNSAVADRFFGGVHNSIALYLGDGDDGFEAEKTTQDNYSISPPGTAQEIPFECSTETSDPNSNYNNTNSYYTAPSDGSYTFDIGAFCFNFSFSGGAGTYESVNITMFLKRYKDNTFADLIETRSIKIAFTVDPTSPSFFERDVDDPGLNNIVQLVSTFYLNANEVVRGEIDIAENSGNTATQIDVDVSDESSYFKTSQVINGGGIYKEYNTEDFRLLLYDFQYPLTYDDFASLLPNNKQKIDFEIDTAWIKRLEYNVRNGLGAWQVITFD